MKAWSRRRFVQYLGLAASAPGLRAAPRQLTVATWPNYHDPDNFRRFEDRHQVAVKVREFGSNEAMLAALLSGRSGFDIVVATNYTIASYVALNLLRPLPASLQPGLAEHEPRFLADIEVNGRAWGMPKNWGTTGYVYDSSALSVEPTSWREFWDLARTTASGRATVHDYPLTAIGNALKYYGYSFNSIATSELAQAEALLMDTRPHLQAISSHAVTEVQRGAVLAMAWAADAVLLQRQRPAIRYVIGREGGEIWCDYYTVCAESSQPELAWELVAFLNQTDNNLREFSAHGAAPTHLPTLARLPRDARENPVLFPRPEQLANLEFGSSETLMDSLRAEILARFSGH
ncbi:MAG TPA: spermidine/putrescine ABC transporter substrate-binding protein [Spongiibacteraceae bacterium]|nr:spermidine/putrescine ABC transporter substrate-binding protein [Spongiibacteraceae bacterium]